MRKVCISREQACALGDVMALPFDVHIGWFDADELTQEQAQAFFKAGGWLEKEAPFCRVYQRRLYRGQSQYRYLREGTVWTAVAPFGSTSGWRGFTPAQDPDLLL